MNRLQVTSLDHVSILITNVEVSRRFYRDVLGLREIPKPKLFDFVALWFELEGAQTLHLLKKPQPDTRSPRHFALRVRDVPEARRYFADRGVLTEETTKIQDCDRFFVYDPDGNRIEIIQWEQLYDPAESGAAELDQS